MVRHNARKKKVWLKKFSNAAAISRKTTVKNTTKGISEVVNHKRYGTEVPKDKLINNYIKRGRFKADLFFVL